MRREEIELLAPAGSYEGFEAAIGAGADAVYVGGAAFGARAYAKNFGEEELLRAIDTAHIHGRKLYLTVNTLLKNRELSEQLYDYLLPYYKEGLDAVIVQDMGVFKMIREMFPGMHLHASTQMTVTGPEGMKFLEEQGASRVVTARELSLEEIRRMHETSPIEIESFSRTLTNRLQAFQDRDAPCIIGVFLCHVCYISFLSINRIAYCKSGNDFLHCKHLFVL